MTQDTLQLFGAPMRHGAAGAAPWPAERLYQLGLYLACRPQWQPREQLAALLWPELDDTSARRNLRKLLFRAARLLPGIESRAEALCWHIESDRHRFELACDAGDWAAALDAYGGPFADGYEHNAPEPYAQWLQFERSRLATLYRHAAGQRLAQLDSDDERARLAQRWLAQDPLDEDALAALVQATVNAGRLAQAERVHGTFVERLSRDLGIEPSTRVRALAAAWQPQAAPARAVAAADDTARTAPAGFVGRRTELLELDALLMRDECRVLTITGPGGFGKSRLARAALARVAGRFDAAHWVGLEDLTDTAQVAPRIASVLGIALSGGAEPLAQVIDSLRARRALLVLDGSEHLDGIARLVESLVAACASIKLLQTSRTRLGIDGEWLLPLPGLPTPDADETEATALRAFDAVKLFELRALAVSPAFDAAHAAVDVAALVRALDGAPLAIELAAAWVRWLPVAEIRREIARSLDLLESSGRAPDRHRSVRASFEHSWRLLGGAEQRALAKLSVFASPFTREAASAVAAAAPPLLAALADKSLLTGLGDGRFRFHALMQQCAHEELGDDAALRQRHARYFANLLARIPETEVGRKDRLDEIEQVIEDCRGAWRESIATLDLATLEAMAPVLMRFIEIKGWLAEGIRMFEAARQAFAAAPAPQLAPAAIERALGSLLYWRGDLAGAEQAIRRAIQACRARRDAAGLGRCLAVAGYLRHMRGEVPRAERYFAESLRLAEAAGDEAGRAQPLNGMALCAQFAGQFERAVGLHEQALALHERYGNSRGQAVVLHDLGSMLRTQRRFDQARSRLQASLALCERHGLASVRQYCLVNLGLLELEVRQLDAAEHNLQQALDADRASGRSLLSALIRIALGNCRLLRGDLPAAEALLRDGLSRAQALGSLPSQLGALLRFAELMALRGERARAAAYASFVAAHPQADPSEHHDARALLDQLGLSAGEAEAATRAVGALELERVVRELLAEPAA